MIAANAFAGTITYTVNQTGVNGLGQKTYRYNYSLSGFDLLANQEIDIRFDPNLYASLSNGIAPAGIDLLVLQPNNPPGAFGDYSALATVNHPSLAGIFSVDFAFLGSGAPGSQAYSLREFKPNGDLLRTIESGFTQAAAGGGAVPEPGTLTLGACGLAMAIALRRARR